MKSIKYLLMLIMFVLLGLSSCTKDNSVNEDIEPFKPKTSTSNKVIERGVTSGEGLDLGCFSVEFPFSMSVDGVVTEVNDEAELEDLLSSLDELTPVDFAYPIEITYHEDGATATVEDGEALGEAFVSCIPDDGWSEPGFPAFLIDELNFCYEMNYPINLINDAGDSFTAQDELEFITLVAENYDLYFVFPISMTSIETGDVVTAENEDELFELLMACEDTWTPVDTIDNPCFGEMLFGCYELGFPVNYTDYSGDVKTAENLDELFEAFLTGDFFDFTFPMTLIDENGVEIVVNNEGEFEEAMEVCEDDGGNGEGDDGELGFIWLTSQDFFNPCFEIIYPIIVTADMGLTTFTLDNEDDLNEEIDNDISVEIVYPLNLRDLSSGDELIFNNIDEINEYIENCD